MKTRRAGSIRLRHLHHCVRRRTSLGRARSAAAAGKISTWGQHSGRRPECRFSPRISSANIEGSTGPISDNGSTVVTTSMTFANPGGSVVVRSSVVDDVGLFGGSTAVYLALLGFGTVLIALAGGTFLAERRSLERRATTDELTGLVKRQFERLADDALLNVPVGTGCASCSRPQRFQTINDTLGHSSATSSSGLCRSAAERRPDTDVVGHGGGDEFVIFSRPRGRTAPSQRDGSPANWARRRSSVTCR
jgi:hypothetical protein